MLDFPTEELEVPRIDRDGRPSATAQYAPPSRHAVEPEFEPEPSYPAYGDTPDVDPVLPDEPDDDPTQEPVIIAHAVTVILFAIVTAGWVTIPSPVIDSVGSVIAVVLSTLAALTARNAVSTRSTVAHLRRRLAQPAAFSPELTAYIHDEVNREITRHDAEVRRASSGFRR